ncbi:hypothetical protein [Clostridioides difficile]|uniref:hypothetical protein n=1 Tax=Clostridioides difficile TaxID=1496 RepID=UPI0010352763|nr:hypothetical protein [Clostridioides difficile]
MNTKEYEEICKQQIEIENKIETFERLKDEESDINKMLKAFQDDWEVNELILIIKKEYGKEISAEIELNENAKVILKDFLATLEKEVKKQMKEI